MLSKKRYNKTIDLPGWSDWQSEFKSDRRYVFYSSITEAMNAVVNLRNQGIILNCDNDYKINYKLDPLLPSNPNSVYSKDWIDWGNFLGIDPIEKRLRFYLDRLEEIHSLYPGKRPSTISNDPKEKSDAQWVSARVMDKSNARDGKPHVFWHPDLEKRAIELGRPRLFWDVKDKAIQKTTDLLDKHQGIPDTSRKHVDAEQNRKDYKWLGQIRAAYNGMKSRNKMVFYEEYHALFEKYDLTDWLGAPKNPRAVQELIRFEKVLQEGLPVKKKMPDGKTNPDYTLIVKCRNRPQPKYRKLAIKYGYPDLIPEQKQDLLSIDRARMKKESLHKFEQILIKKSKDPSYPKWNTSDFGRLKRIKQAKNGTISDGTKWYKEYEEIANKYGLLNIFGEVC